MSTLQTITEPQVTTPRKQDFEMSGHVSMSHRNEAAQKILDEIQSHCHDLINRALAASATLPVNYNLNMSLKERGKKLKGMEGQGSLHNSDDVHAFIALVGEFRAACEEKMQEGNGKTYEYEIAFKHP